MGELGRFCQGIKTQHLKDELVLEIYAQYGNYS